jgi:alpha-tubulin suppressor-like RCC1 family protein
VVSNVARVVIATPPVITGQPQPVEVYATTILFLSVRANSTAPLTYVWRRNGNPIPGATADTYSVSSAQTAQSGNYDVVVTTMAGSVTSETVAVLVKPVVPVRITQHPVSQSVFVGDTVTFTVAATGDPAPTYSWRFSRADLPGIETQLNETSPTLVISNLTTSNSGTVYRCIVSNLDSVVASDSALLTVSEVGQTKVAAGRFHSMRLDYFSKLYVAGLNSSGQFGNGTNTNSWSPWEVHFGGQTFADVSSFAFHSLLLSTAKELWATGSNATGQLGDGTLVNKYNYVKVATDVAGMAAGFFHTAYVKTDGTLWTVGGNDSGQLGDGAIVNRSTPAQIATGVIDVAAGIRQTLFIKTDGTLWGVGNLDGSDNYVTTPVQLATNVKAVAAGGYHSIFLKHDGTVWTLGYNATGQLGDGTFNSRLAPVQIATDARAVAVGYFHSAFIKSDHTAWTFGNNGLGQLGNGTNVTGSTPTQVATQVATVAAGESFTLFTKLDGSLWATGLNSDGQFGNGTTTSVVVPTLIRAGAIFAPAIPLEVRASVDGSPAVTRITWQPSAAATSYEVWRGATNDSSLATLVASGLRWPLHLDASPSAASAFYWIKAVNAAGASALSAVATATPMPTNPPVITVPPTGATVDVGATVNFSVTATGDAPLSYQWRRNGDPLPSATAATYSIASAVVTDSGDYTVVVTNPAGSVTSDIAVLTVNKLAQTITFLAPADRGYTTTPFALTASASSSLPVTFTVESGPASINGDTLTLTGVGPVTVRAAQAGNATYAAAMSIDRSFTVSANLASWQLTRFTSAELLDAQISGPNADPDGDGLSNLLEYALGLEPRTATTSGLPEVAATASEWTYTYTRPSDRTDVTYAVEISTDLGAWTTDGVTHELVSTDSVAGTQTWRARTPLTTDANVFFRLKSTTANDQ